MANRSERNVDSDRYLYTFRSDAFGGRTQAKRTSGAEQRAVDRVGYGCHKLAIN